MSTSCGAPGDRYNRRLQRLRGSDRSATSGSRMSAPSPRPNAFLATGDYLLGKLDVGFGAFTMNVVEYDWLAMAGCLGQANISRDHGLEYLRAEEASEDRRVTWRDSVVRSSYIVRTMPSMARFWIQTVRRIRIRVSSSSETPSSAKYSHWIGIKDGVAGD